VKILKVMVLNFDLSRIFERFNGNVDFLFCGIATLVKKGGLLKLVRQLSQSKTITIPSKVLEHIGSKPGDLFEITDDRYRIILIPKVIEDRFTEQEWEKLNQIVKEKRAVYKEAEGAKSHLKGLASEV